METERLPRTSGFSRRKLLHLTPAVLGASAITAFLPRKLEAQSGGYIPLSQAQISNLGQESNSVVASMTAGGVTSENLAMAQSHFNNLYNSLFTANFDAAFKPAVAGTNYQAVDVMATLTALRLEVLNILLQFSSSPSQVLVNETVSMAWKDVTTPVAGGRTITTQVPAAAQAQQSVFNSTCANFSSYGSLPYLSLTNSKIQSLSIEYLNGNDIGNPYCESLDWSASVLTALTTILYIGCKEPNPLFIEICAVQGALIAAIAILTFLFGLSCG